MERSRRAYPFRWYARANPNLQKLICSPQGLPISMLKIRDLGPVYEDVDPGGESPAYLGPLREVPADRLHMHITEGMAATPDGTRYPSLAVIFREYRGGWPWGHPQVYPAPLVRNFPRYNVPYRKP